MISCKTLFNITGVLTNCSFAHCEGETVIVDSNAEVLGKLDYRTPGVIVYSDYEYSEKVFRRLKKAGINVELMEIDMNEVTRILYDN